MNETLEAPAGRRDESRKPLPPLLPGGSQSRSIPIGIVATILLHLILLLGTPKSFQKPYQPNDTTKDDLVFDLTPEQPPPEPSKFVEANPDAPANKPDKTENFAAQDQQAAQEKPTDEKNDMPRTEGMDIPATAVVTGQKAEPMESANPGQPTPQTQPAQEAQVSPNQPEALKPLPGFEEFKGDDEQGLGAMIAKNSQNPRPVDKEVEGQEVPNEDQVVMAQAPTSPGRPTPRPRPKLQNVRPAPLANQPIGVSNAGTTAVDSNFSEFGDYLQELIETVSAQWDRILTASATRPTAGSHVYVTFVLQSDGTISRIDEVETTADKPGTYACTGAIQEPQPYRPWTKEMVAVLGTEQVIRFRFYYR